MGATPTGTVTFLFTDIESSTQKWEANAAVMSESLKIHDNLITKIIENNNGYVFKTVGDAFCVAFSTAIDCLSASIAIQRQLSVTEWSGPQIKVRMGIHTGEAEERDNDYFGPAVNRVARISAASHGGQIVLSESTHQLICDTLPSGIKLRSLGKRRLKDLNRPEVIFQVDFPELENEFPALKTLDLAKNNLPLVLTSFIGRVKEQQELNKLFTSSRFITLVGPGGIGKTRLSLQIASNNLDLFPDGIWFVDLVKVTSSEGIPSAILQAFSINEDPGSVVLDKIKNYLRAKLAVLILDNCEHLIDAAADIVEDLLSQCPKLTVLATSREALKITGEITYQLSPLSTPNEKDVSNSTMESLTAFESVRLFIDRAVMINPRFEVSNRSAPALAQICTWLDGIPLAIELATARTRMFSVEEIKERLSENFSFLKGGSRKTHKRQQTLYALIDWSYALLGEEERTLFRRLSVFSGGWTLEAAEAVCDPSLSLESSKVSLFEMVNRLYVLSKDEQDRALIWKPQKKQGAHQRLDIIDLMESLIEKSLVEWHEVNGMGRYRFIESIRFFAAQELEEKSEKKEYMARLTDYLLPLVSIIWIEEIIQGKINYDWIEEEYKNLVAAVEWLLEAEETHEKALRIITALCFYWTGRGNIEEGIALSNRAYNTVDLPSNSNTLAEFLMHSSVINSFLSDYKKAKIFMDEYYKTARTTCTGIEEGYAANYYSMCLFSSIPEKAVELLEKSVMIFDKLNASTAVNFGKASALGNLAFFTQLMGNPEKSKNFGKEALELLHESRNPSSLRTALLTNLSSTELYFGNYHEALKYAEEATTLGREIKLSWITECIYNLANAHRCMGNLVEAEDFYREVITYSNDFGDRMFLSSSFLGLALISNKRGAISCAVEYIKASIDNCSYIDSWEHVNLDFILLYTGPVLNTLELFNEIAMILGVIEEEQTLILSNLPAHDKDTFDQIAARTKTAMGEEPFKSIFAMGKEMGIDKVKEKTLEALEKIATK